MTLLLAMRMVICQHVKKHTVKKIRMEDGENSHMMKFWQGIKQVLILHG